MLLPGIGEEGQRRIASSSVLIVGCGALGCVAADSLARAGVGRLTLIDRDVVEITNLQRQILYTEQDARDGIPKAQAAANRLRAVNSQITIEPVVADLNARNVEPLVGKATAIVDATDNFQTRYLLNDACVKLARPLVYGGVVGTSGMTMTIWVPPRSAWRSNLPTPCLRCIFPEPPPPGSSPTCDTAGVLGPMVSVVASIQVAEALKVLLGRDDLLRPVLSQFDIWNNQRHTIDLSMIDRSNCVCCAKRQFEFLEGDRSDSGTTTLCGTDSVQVLPDASEHRFDLPALAARLSAHGAFTTTPHFLRGRFSSERNRASGNPIELTVFPDGRAIVKGTTDPAIARSIYARYIGT
jgi:adenylyltransferase/sulfurtransferase